MQMTSWHIIPSSTAPRTPIQDRTFPQIGSGAISSAATIHVSYTIKGAYFHICAYSEAIAGLPCLEEALDCFRDAGMLQFLTDKEHWNEELLLQFYATLHIPGYNRDPKTWVLE